MRTRVGLRSVAPIAALVALSVTLAGCQRWNSVKAMYYFKEANTAYQQQEYQEAVENYELAVGLDPSLSAGYFYLANSYDNLYRPARAGEPENDALLEQALENYARAADTETDPARKKLALQYLVSVFGPDKLNDPYQAEPILQELIELDPNDTTNYFALVKLYEDSGRYEEAEAVLTDLQAQRPDDPEVYLQMAGYYNRQGEFEQTMAALQERTRIEPENPEAYYTIATHYWDKAFRDLRLTDEEKREYVLSGIEAVDQALEIRDSYIDALVYKGLLLRLQATLESDVATQNALLAEADDLRDRAEELQAQQQTGM